ncbi:MAG: hypothetical protein HOP15_14960 [Planctomycetes bacterium]|nr:hypothetical protein [Planctomycetota bacterium]
MPAPAQPSNEQLPNEPPPTVYRPCAAGALGRVGVAVASFVLVCSVLRMVAVPAGGSAIGGKLETWQAHAREYDTVFLGSSHVLRAFVPAEFDRVSGEFGRPTRSFNFGLQAVHLLEQRHLLGAILDAHPRLARVFFEYQWLTPQIDPENAFNARTLYWHDPATTLLAAERALHWGRELGDGLTYAADPARQHSIFDVAMRLVPGGACMAEEHLAHGLTERLMIGRGKDVLKGLLGRAHGESERSLANNGYVSLEEDAALLAARGEARNAYSARRERFLANQEAYARDVDTLDAAQQSFGDGEWVNAELVRVDDFELVAQIAREVRARGVEFVLVILPSQSANRPFEERLSEELGALVLRYNLPERYPQLYDPAKRFDSGHLSHEGALYFSSILARDYAGQSTVGDDAGESPGESKPIGEVTQ